MLDKSARKVSQRQSFRRPVKYMKETIWSATSLATSNYNTNMPS